MQKNRRYDDPFPTTIESVREDMDYWARLLTQGVGLPGSIWYENVKARLDQLRSLETRLAGRSGEHGTDLIFVSCGQFTAEERELGHQVCALIEKHTPFRAYFADAQSSLQGLTDNILSALNSSIGFVAIMHPRGKVTFSNGQCHTRGSVWIEQEIAIAAFVTQVLKRNIHVAAYVHRDLRREGMRDQLHLNPVLFESNEDVLKSLRDLLPTWGRKQAAQPVPAPQEKADIRVDTETSDRQHRFVIRNWGNVSARDVTFDLALEPGMSTPLVGGDYDKKIPIRELAPGSQCPLLAALSFDTGTSFNAKWSWRNPDGSEETRGSLLAF